MDEREKREKFQVRQLESKEIRNREVEAEQAVGVPLLGFPTIHMVAELLERATQD